LLPPLPVACHRIVTKLKLFSPSFPGKLLARAITEALRIHFLPPTHFAVCPMQRLNDIAVMPFSPSFHTSHRPLLLLAKKARERRMEIQEMIPCIALYICCDVYNQEQTPECHKTHFFFLHLKKSLVQSQTHNHNRSQTQPHSRLCSIFSLYFPISELFWMMPHRKYVHIFKCVSLFFLGFFFFLFVLCFPQNASFSEPGGERGGEAGEWNGW
jgi:hypothetical protein